MGVPKLSINRNLLTRLVFSLINISILYLVGYLLGWDIANKALLLILVLPLNLVLPFFLDINYIETSNILPKVLLSILNIFVHMVILFSNITIKFSFLLPVLIIVLPYFTMLDFRQILSFIVSIINSVKPNIVLMDGGQGSSSAFTPSSQSAPGSSSGGGNPNPGGGNSGGGPEHAGSENGRTKSKRLRDVFKRAREERGDTLRTSEIGIRTTDSHRNMGNVPRNPELTQLANDVKNHHSDIWKGQQLSQLRITRSIVYKMDGIDCDCPHTPLPKKG